MLSLSPLAATLSRRRTSETMLKIGVFAQVSRVSIKMLRHYDEMGLLKPVFVDDFSGYRYYSLEQLPHAHRIIALKDLGFSLDQIALLLSQKLPPEQLRRILSQKQEELSRQVQEDQARLERVKARLRQIDQEGKMSDYEVVLKKIEPMLIAGISEAVPEGEQVTPVYYRVFTELFQYASEQDIDTSGRQLSVDTSLDSGWKVNDAEVTIEAAVRLDRSSPETGRVRVHTLPAVDMMACTIHHGDYDLLNQAYEALLRWTEANGYEVDGTNRHLYLQTGDTAESNITEVQFPVEKK